MGPLLDKLWFKAALDGLGVFWFVLLGTGTSLYLASHPNSFPPTFVFYAWIIGVVSASHIVGPYSGGHFNPSVSVAIAAVNWGSWRQAWSYSLAQILGGLFAVFLLKVIFPDAASYGSTVPRSWGSGLLSETLLTFLLLFGCIFSSAYGGIFKRFGYGLMIYLVAPWGSLLAGATSLNFARSIGGNIIDNHVDVLWIYAAGPTLGCFAAFALYKFLAEKGLLKTG